MAECLFLQDKQSLMNKQTRTTVMNELPLNGFFITCKALLLAVAYNSPIMSVLSSIL